MKRGKEVYLLALPELPYGKWTGNGRSESTSSKNNLFKRHKKNIGIILNGQTGEVIVNGKKYNAIMNPIELSR